MGSGKSTVGPLLAEALGWRFVDADRRVEAEEGRTIPEIFRDDGEEAFREIEHRVTSALLARSSLVIASGGGWPCRESRLEALPRDTLSVWLRVGAERALERTRSEAAGRPLLDVEDPLERARELLGHREPFYRKARWSVDTEVHSPASAADMVARRLRTDPERPLHV